MYLDNHEKLYNVKRFRSVIFFYLTDRNIEDQQNDGKILSESLCACVSNDSYTILETLCFLNNCLNVLWMKQV